MSSHRFAGWVCAAVTIGLSLIAVPIVLITPNEALGPNLLAHVPFVGMAAVGALIASRRPGNSTAGFLLGASFLNTLNGLALAYANYAFPSHPDAPYASFAAWLAFWAWLPGTSLLAAVLIVFPSGVPPNRFWRWVVRAAIVTGPIVLIAALPMLSAPPEQLLGGPSSVTFPGSGFIRMLATGPIAAFLPLGFVAIVIRYVRARGVERQQMKWFVVGAAVLAVSTLVMVGGSILLGIEDPIRHPIGYISIGIGMMAIPVSAGIAILRHGLYDIDRIISRTFSYAIVTAFLGSLFAALVIVPAQIIRQRSAPDYVIAGATLIVAALIQPVRRSVQDVVDRRFNRRRYEAEHTIESFQGRLREQIDIDALGAELREIVGRTMQPDRVWLWVKS